MHTEIISLDKERNVSLTAFIQPIGGEFSYIRKRPAVLVIPGGGYQMCSDREAEVIAIEYLRAGYDAFILRYSIKKNAVWPNPLNDYEQAMEMIRSRAGEWNVYEDKIAVVGFSAGGHLAACAATMAKNKPNAAILGYAVTTETTARMCLKSAPDTVNKVDKNTCPCFVFATRTDNIVPIENSIRFIDALNHAGISFESHIYAYGPHGFSSCNSATEAPGTVICNRVPHWVNDSIEWLKDMFGDFNLDGGMTKPSCNKKVFADEEDFLSIDCRIGYLMRHPEGQKVIAPLMQKLQEQTATNSINFEDSSMDMSAMADNITLRNLFSYAKLSQQAIDQVDTQLNAIPNN